jgi:subtilase family serine protease
MISPSAPGRLRQLILATVSVTALAAAPQARAAAADAIDRGLADPAQTIAISIHLLKHNDGLFEQTLASLYDPLSPSYHHWMTDADLARFSPSQAEKAAVTAALQRGGLSVAAGDKYGFSLVARGTIGNVARLFHTEIHQFERNGSSFRANIRPAMLGGDAGRYVVTVSGIASHKVRPQLMRALDPLTHKPYPARPLVQAFAAKGKNPFGTTTEILTPVGTNTLTDSGSSYPASVVTGYGYNVTSDTGLVPDYAPADLEAAYGLPAVYSSGITGAGQTIVLLEAYGYPTARADADAAAKLAGLPRLTTSNFSVVYPIGKPSNPNIGIESGWNIEIALDIQSSHAIAPDAKIIVAACNGQDDDSFSECIRKITEQDLGFVVSDSWEEDQDLFAGPPEQLAFEADLKIAAAKGISFQFSTGDGGDGGLGTPLGAPGVPAVAPHATAVGGTAILNEPGSSTQFPSSWGDNFTPLQEAGVVVPPSPANATFVGGGGGGESVFWPKPQWQSALPGTGRQTPDVSALGDPYTGFPIVITSGGSQGVEQGWGGTSLSSPIFTALWALANEKAGKSLGDAGIALASLTTGLTDVTDTTSYNSLSVTYEKSKKGSKTYSAEQLFAGLNPSQQPSFISAVWDATAFSLDGWYGFAFGLDSSLTVGTGWDNATGFGTPNGLAFINAAAAKSR